MDQLLGAEIGRGGFGTVYVKKDDASKCIKVSHKSRNHSNSCRKWSNEYQKIIDFMKMIEKHSAYKKLDMVRVVVPTEFVNTDELCYMVLPRIFRPEGRDSKLPTIQAQLGWGSVRVVHKGRGEFIGRKEVMEYVDDKDLKQACYELGVMMALIHHIGKNDAYDVELYLGKEAGSKKCRFYLADFDLSEKVVEYDPETIKRMTWSLDAVPYFPKASVDEETYALFKKGYDTIASHDVSDAVFEEYD